jgi:hypothetical protein
MKHTQSFEDFLNESVKVDLGGAEPLEIKQVEGGGISITQASKLEKGKKNVIVIPKEFILQVTTKMELEYTKMK